MTRNLAVAAALAAAMTLVACGPGGRDPSNDVDGGNGGGVDSGGNGGGDGSGGDGCSEESKLIYVVDQNNKMSQYSPVTKTFTDLGSLVCPASFGATPFSMGVSRDAIAWVLYSSGELFRVETANNLACTKALWTPGTQGHAVFGMGFSTEAVGGTSEQLFIAGGSGPTVPSSTLAKLDITTFAPSTVGTVTGWPELTGTGAAELWGFFPATSGTRIDQINKANGSAMRTFLLPTLNDPLQAQAWAFGFHGGDFHVFLKKSSDANTIVYQVNGMTGVIVGSTVATGRTIVGAGSSTCAPIIL